MGDEVDQESIDALKDKSTAEVFQILRRAWMENVITFLEPMVTGFEQNVLMEGAQDEAKAIRRVIWQGKKMLELSTATTDEHCSDCGMILPKHECAYPKMFGNMIAQLKHGQALEKVDGTSDSSAEGK